MKIKVIIKTIYGNEVYYPDNEAAHSICKMTGLKTLRISDIAICVNELGFTLVHKRIEKLSEYSLGATNINLEPIKRHYIYK